MLKESWEGNRMQEVCEDLEAGVGENLLLAFLGLCNF